MFLARAMHDIIFCFERSNKKYYGELLSPAINFVLSFTNLFPSPLLIFSSFPFSMSFYLIKLLLRRARPLSGYELANSLTCVTPTKILLLLNHLKTIILKHFTDMLVCNAS
jgi:hypothetical protein